MRCRWRAVHWELWPASERASNPDPKPFTESMGRARWRGINAAWPRRPALSAAHILESAPGRFVGFILMHFCQIYRGVLFGEEEV
ncbi:hypothetical protein NDU88_000703 [Pleurodeles waltl]|uniref:Uncharacterized protein n=1 Tax=Pleurodeles waltl TaxID=8319 RepID=A0AAV7MHK4_PLEWA|nr:hypothetical protein NDU88_000703 [Pleurodeles waltl]